MNRHISYFFLFSYFILFLFAISKSAYGVTVPAGDIRTAVENAVREYAARQSLDFEIIVPHAQDVEIKSIAAPVIRASLVGKAIRSAATPVRVEFLDGEGSIISRIHLVAQIRTYALAVVITRGVERGDTLRAEDLLLKRMEVSAIRGYYTKTEGIAGTLAAQSMKTGTIIRTSTVKPEPLVHRGDQVTMKATVGGVELVATGVARQNGGLNEHIRVYNTQTKSSVICRVMDAKTVMIEKTGG